VKVLLNHAFVSKEMNIRFINSRGQIQSMYGPRWKRVSRSRSSITES